MTHLESLLEVQRLRKLFNACDLSCEFELRALLRTVYLASAYYDPDMDESAYIHMQALYREVMDAWAESVDGNK